MQRNLLLLVHTAFSVYTNKFLEFCGRSQGVSACNRLDIAIALLIDDFLWLSLDVHKEPLQLITNFGRLDLGRSII